MTYWKRLLCVLFCMCLLLPAISVKAEVKQAEIITTTEQKDLMVSFSFDEELRDITFISPSGVRKTRGSADVVCETGDRWSVYTIKNAEPGTWRVEYDLGANTEIAYNVLSEGSDNYGLWIQNFTAQKTSDTEMQFSFRADFEGQNIGYNYTITAVSENQTPEVIASGTGMANMDQTVRAGIGNLLSGTYKYRLSVKTSDGGFEVFDNAETQEFRVDNQQPSGGNQKFDVVIDMNSLNCQMDWSGTAPGYAEAYYASFIADGNTLYDGELEPEYDSYSVTFPDTTKKLELSFAYRINGSWSQKSRKEIDFQQTALYSENAEVTGNPMLEISYRTPDEVTLYASVNDVSGSYVVQGEGKASLKLQAGANAVAVTMQPEDHVTYVLNQNIYYDTIAPEITFYENLDQKQVNAESISILGRVAGASTLTVNGTAVEIGEDGSFEYQAKLSSAENKFQFQAADANGNITQKILTIFKSAPELRDVTQENGLIRYLPMLAATLFSLLVIVLCFAFMYRSSGGKTGTAMRVLLRILAYLCLIGADAFCIYRYVERIKFERSVTYLEMTEKSFYQASEYLSVTRYYWYGILAITAVLLLCCIVSLIRHMAARKKKKNYY